MIDNFIAYLGATYIRGFTVCLLKELQHVNCSSLLCVAAGKASESDTKQRVSAIHELKEKLKKDTEQLKDIKNRLKTIQDKQKAEKDVSSLVSCLKIIKYILWLIVPQVH